MKMQFILTLYIYFIYIYFNSMWMKISLDDGFQMGNGGDGADLFVLTRGAGGFPPMIDVPFCMG